jgi:hypothetical protein
MNSLRVSAVLCAVIAAAPFAAAQQAPQPAAAQPAAAQPAAGQPGAPQAASAAAPPAPPSYSYDGAGRRDPFVSLLRRGTETSGANRPKGLSGLAIGEITVKGIVRDRSGFIAMVQGPDTKQTFIIRSGEKLMDGTVKAITADGVVFSQDITDPLSLVKQKEIRKTVRTADGSQS